MKKIMNKIVCYFFGCRFPIEWSKENLPNGEIAEIGIAAPYKPCFRRGRLIDQPNIDFPKINSEIKDDFNIYHFLSSIDNIEKKIEMIYKKIDYIRMGKCIECDERGMIDDPEIKGAASSCKCGYNNRRIRSLLLKRKE